MRAILVSVVALIVVWVPMAWGELVPWHPKKFAPVIERSADRGLQDAPTFVSADMDTIVLAEFDFEAPPSVDPQAWTSVDLSGQKGIFWHVDDFMVPADGGNQAMWCGVRDSTGLFCHYGCLPGYGNGWDQVLEMPTGLAAEGDVTLSFVANWDTEAGYDRLYIEYERENNGRLYWRELGRLEGLVSNDTVSYVIPAANLDGSVRLRFRFRSDGLWSDEDCLYDTNGAVQLDNIAVSDSMGVLHFEDFEDESLGDTSSDDGVWAPPVYRSAGDYAGIFDTSDLFLSCTHSASRVWGFMKDSPMTCGYCCDPDTLRVVPGFGWVDDDPDLWNEIRSPPFDWTRDIGGNPVGAEYTKTVVQLSWYSDLDWEGGIFWSWGVGSLTPGSACERPDWQSYPSLIGGANKEWVRSSLDVSDYVAAGADSIMIALAAIDASAWTCAGIPECGNCPTVSPLFDNVRVIRVKPGGLQWYASDFYMFQDAFPADGTVTGYVQMRNSYGSDWVGVRVLDDVNGLATEPLTGTPAVYVHVRSSGGQSGPDVLGEDTSYLSDDGEWTIGVCEKVSTDRFNCDLSDTLFVPGDSVSFYFSAVNGIGVRRYFSLRSGVVKTEAEARQLADYARCLPRGGDILCVRLGARDPYLEDAFQRLGLQPDWFRIRNTWLNTDFAQSSQLVDVYRTIVWSSTDGYLDGHEVADFLNQTSVWDPGLYVTSNHTPYGYNYNPLLGLTVLAYAHYLEGLPFSPVVDAVSSSIFDHIGETPPGALDRLIASNYECPSLGGFDVMTPAYGGQAAMVYSNNPAYVASMTKSTTNLAGRTYRTVTDGFAFERIIDDGPGELPDRVQHLRDILEFLRGDTITVTGIEEAPWFANALEQNYPNPFNPATTIRYSIKERAHVSLNVYNAAGQLVATLVDEVQSPEQVSPVTWHGLNNASQSVSTGVYFYRLETKDFSQTRKMVLLK